MKFFKLNIICLLFSLAAMPELKAQSLVEAANYQTEASNVFLETIKIISGSKKIFILSNNNQQLNPGDFISLALEDKLAARAVVAKVHQGQVGIKIIKIYSVAQWARLKRELEVQVIRGDDSYFGRTPPPTEEPSARIRSEDDLYTGDVVVADDVGIFDEGVNRHIRPDNVVSIGGSFMDVDEIPSRGGGVRAVQFSFSWAFQFTDNFFAEGIYGRAMFTDYPGPGAATLINQFVGRIKYNIKGPLYTFFMPYVGFQAYTVVSPDAGRTNNPAINREEEALIDSLQRSGPVFGITVLRRLVPGWFIKADLGTDVVNLGFAIEF